MSGAKAAGDFAGNSQRADHKDKKDKKEKKHKKEKKNKRKVEVPINMKGDGEVRKPLIGLCNRAS